ncbi:hypothetical protein, partial [Sphingomonas sp.]|uniref:hypothetical protein n=1 Tax=Sphingomonas sp. TaxID=28214 RepID=UPI00257AC244
PEPEKVPAPHEPVVPPVAPASVKTGFSALDMLARRAGKPATDSDTDAADSAAQGEAPELHMQMEKDDAGTLTVRSAGYHKAEPERTEDDDAGCYSEANRSMADEEKNILRHRDDYEAYQEMQEHPDPGGYER